LKFPNNSLVQVKKNQSKTYAAMKEVFKDAEHQKPNDVLPRKKRGHKKMVGQKLAVCG